MTSMLLERFEAIAQAEPYLRKGVFYSEAYLFLAACERQRCDLVIESGVKEGMSTRLILASGVCSELIAIDKAQDIRISLAQTNVPFRFSVRFSYKRADSLKLIPDLLEEHRARRIGVLIDGPKGRAALDLARLCLKSNACRVAAVHDAEQGLKGQTFHSHVPQFVNIRERLDRFIPEAWRRKYPLGPGLGVWEKP